MCRHEILFVLSVFTQSYDPENLLYLLFVQTFVYLYHAHEEKKNIKYMLCALDYLYNNNVLLCSYTTHRERRIYRYEQTSIMMKKKAEKNIKTGTLNLHGRFLEYIAALLFI